MHNCIHVRRPKCRHVQVAEASSFIFLLFRPGNQACHHSAVHCDDACILLHLSKKGGTEGRGGGLGSSTFWGAIIKANFIDASDIQVQVSQYMHLWLQLYIPLWQSECVRVCAGAMSEDDRDIDVESADDVPDIGMEATASCQSPSLTLGVSAATCVNM